MKVARLGSKNLVVALLLAVLSILWLPTTNAFAWDYPDSMLDKLNPKYKNYPVIPGKDNPANPFSDRFSDAEIESSFKTASSTSLTVFKAVHTSKDGKVTELPWNFIPISQGGTVDVYVALKADHTLYNVVFTTGADNTFAKANPDGTMKKITVADTKDLKPTVLEVDGKSIDTDTVVFERAKNQHYIHVQYPIDDKAFNYGVSLTIPSSASLQGNVVNGKMTTKAKNEFNRLYGYSAPAVEFRQVDDISLREVEGLAAGDKIPARNEGKGAYARQAHFERSSSIKQLADRQRFTVLNDGNKNGNDVLYTKFPVVRVDNGVDPSKVKLKWYEAMFYLGFAGQAPYYPPRHPGYMTGYENPEAPDRAGVIRPTFKELLGRHIPGYVQKSHDIDMPAGHDNFLNDKATKEDPGNHYITTGVADDGSLLNTKYYYVTYRPIPVPVTITKIADGDRNKTLPGAVFDLYREKDGQSILIKAGLTTDDQGRIVLGENKGIDDLKAIGLNDASVDIEKHAYLDGGNIYLMPGKYFLQETKAPQGYKAQSDKIFFEVAPYAEQEDLAANVQNFDVSNTAVPATVIKPSKHNKPTIPVESAKPTHPIALPRSGV